MGRPWKRVARTVLVSGCWLSRGRVRCGRPSRGGCEAVAEVAREAGDLPVRCARRG